MKILVSGVHFSPVLSLLPWFRNEEVEVVGRKYTFQGDNTESFEYKVSKDFHLTFHSLSAPRFQRNNIFSLVLMGPALIASLIKAGTILSRSKPDVVLLFGGYVSLPVAFAAKLRGVPIVLHEQTQGMGLANKIISRFADEVCISFESSRKFAKNKNVTLTGNPVRPEIFEIRKELPVPPDFKKIYVTGGSTGAHFINELVERNLEKLLSKYVLIHQTGDSSFRDFERLEEVRKKLPDELQKRYFIQKYIFPDLIGWVYRSADLVISRSGINTVHELLALGKLALLIPLPTGQKNEQLENANYFLKSGRGECREQKNLNDAVFLSLVDNMILNENKYPNSRQDSSNERDTAAVKIADVVYLVHEKKRKAQKL